MSAADDSLDSVVYDAADQVRHDLLSPLTTISAHTQLLARDLRRSPSLAEEERVKMLASITTIENEIHTLCAVIDGIGLPSRDEPTDSTDGKR
jgi:signal transduction histidine kinase